MKRGKCLLGKKWRKFNKKQVQDKCLKILFGLNSIFSPLPRPQLLCTLGKIYLKGVCIGGGE